MLVTQKTLDCKYPPRPLDVAELVACGVMSVKWHTPQKNKTHIEIIKYVTLQMVLPCDSVYNLEKNMLPCDIYYGVSPCYIYPPQ